MLQPARSLTLASRLRHLRGRWKHPELSPARSGLGRGSRPSCTGTAEPLLPPSPHRAASAASRGASLAGTGTSGSGRGHGAGQGRVCPQGGPGQRSPQGPEASAPRGAGTGAWHPLRPRGAAPAPPLGARARRPISASGAAGVPPSASVQPIRALRWGECYAARPLPCGSYKRDALESPESACDWRHFWPIALRSGSGGAP